MKIVKYNNQYQIHCAQSAFKDVLDITGILKPCDLEFIAEATTYKEFQSNIQNVLNTFACRYPFNKLYHVLADGVFTRKRDKKVTLSRRGSSYINRLSRMVSNYSLAERLGIECHLKNKLLEKSNDYNETELLGL